MKLGRKFIATNGATEGWSGMGALYHVLIVKQVRYTLPISLRIHHRHRYRHRFFLPLLTYDLVEIPVRDCLDDPSYKLITKKGYEKPCKWIGENIWRKNQYCSTTTNGYDINAVCAESCQTCADFSITLVNAGNNTTYDKAFVKAKKRWESIIIGDLTDVTNPRGIDLFNDMLAVNCTGGVDDIVIGYQIGYIDGPGKVLGYAGPVYYRPRTNAPLSGLMNFDEDDFSSLAADDISVIIMHEMVSCRSHQRSA